MCNLFLTFLLPNYTFSVYRPLREEELLTSRIQQYPLPETGLLIQKKESKKNKSEKRPEKTTHKKVKKSKHNKKVDLMLPELASDVGNDLLIETGDNGDSKNDLAPDDASNKKQRETLNTEKQKKSKKDVKDKDSKKKKSSKKGYNFIFIIYYFHCKHFISSPCWSVIIVLEFIPRHANVL